MKKLSKNAQMIIFAAVGLVFLVIVMLILNLTKPKEEEEPEETQSTSTSASVKISEKNNSEVTKIDVENSYESYTIKRVGTGDELEFTIDSLSDAQLNQDTFKANVNYASTITAKQLVEESADLEKYGLKGPAAVFHVYFDDGTDLVVKVGSEAPLDNTTYVCFGDSTDVYTIHTYKVKPYTEKSTIYVNTSLLAELDETSDITVENLKIQHRDGETIVIDSYESRGLEPPAFSTHIITSHNDLAVGADKTEFVYSMYGLTAASAEGDAGGELEKYGLDNPLCTVSMKSDGKEYTLYIGNKAYVDTVDATGNTIQSFKGYYGTFSATGDMLYIFESSELVWLDTKVDEIITKLFLIPYIMDVDSYTVQLGGEKFTVKCEGESEDMHFFIDGEEIDTDLAKKMYQFLISASAEEIYLEEVSGTPVASYTYKYKDTSKADDVVEFYDSPTDRKVIIVLNGKTMFKSRNAYITRLEQNIEEFKTGGVISTTW